MTSGLILQTRLVRGAFTLDLDLTLPGRGLTALFEKNSHE
jgi:hypothetical protein